MIIGGNAKLIMCFCVNLIENRTKRYAMADACDSSSPTWWVSGARIQGPKSQLFTWNFEGPSPNIHPSNLQHPGQMGRISALPSHQLNDWFLGCKVPGVISNSCKKTSWELSHIPYQSALLSQTCSFSPCVTGLPLTHLLYQETPPKAKCSWILQPLPLWNITMRKVLNLHLHLLRNRKWQNNAIYRVEFLNHGPWWPRPPQLKTMCLRSNAIKHWKSGHFKIYSRSTPLTQAEKIMRESTVSVKPSWAQGLWSQRPGLLSQQLPLHSPINQKRPRKK